MTTPTRTPYCTKIRYGITGAPILTEGDLDGSHVPGIGLAPTLIELVYSAPRDGKPARISASVTGTWTRFGEPADGQVTTHFDNGPDGWPEWLAAEARLHDPNAPLPEGFKRATCVTVACAVCGYGYDEDEYTAHFSDLAEAHKVLRDAGWTVLADGRVLCHIDDEDDHDEQLRAIGEAPTA